MYELEDFFGKNLHFVGVGGVSMSKLAIYSKTFARRITGSDAVYRENFERLNDAQIEVYTGSNIAKITDIDYLIYSSAVPDNDAEVSFARNHGVPTIERNYFLEIISRHFKYVVAIAGTHGKSTVTAILDNIFHKASLDYLAHVGADEREPQPYNGGEDYFLTEACEYRRSFLHLSPLVGVVLNVDYDHPDEYRTREEYSATFDTFMDNSRIVVASDSVSRTDAITFGESENATYRIQNIAMKSDYTYFELINDKRKILIKSPLLGIHNIYNVAAAFVVADTLAIPKEIILEGISTYQGIRRRFEKKGETINGATLISDYAHHPEEIKRAIECGHLITKGKVYVVFEPHTYSRTKLLIDEFRTAFYWADEVVILPTYGAREDANAGMNSTELISNLEKHTALYFENYDKAKDYISKRAEKGDVVLVLGAGSIDSLANMLVSHKNSK